MVRVVVGVGGGLLTIIRVPALFMFSEPIFVWWGVFRLG